MTKSVKPEKAEGVAAVNRALAVLQAFEHAPEGQSLAVLATTTGLYESTILRLLDSLIAAGFVKRLSDGRYVVGPKVLPLAEMYRQSFRLADFALPLLRQLAADSQECAGLYVREGDRRVCLHHVQPQRTVRTHVLEGEMFPLDKGAAGRVILALDEAMTGKPYDQIRKQGYAVTSKERDPESAAIACPVFARGTRLLGAISLVIPLYRFSPAAVERLLPMVQRQALALTHDLGGISPYADRELG
ncbi:IclR family transcriptional regulator [Ottowia thiooxydans]|uniref:IclR family transcriptional regulator n=1 Tax=Ottowia thiooxydans TaxID=219182 RepID=UPI000424D937|nr:IclR family transcriptional regulator [Ottowia thiooxydans]